MKVIFTQISGPGLMLKRHQFSNWAFNEEQINESCRAIISSIDKIIKTN